MGSQAINVQQVYGSSTPSVTRFMGEGYAGLNDSPSCNLAPQMHRSERCTRGHGYLLLIPVSPDLLCPFKPCSSHTYARPLRI